MFTEEQFTQAMRDAVAERGADYVYTQVDEYIGCQYTEEDGEVGCLIGLALFKLDSETVPVWNAMGAMGADVVLGKLVPDAVAFAARRAQSRQDDGLPWGESLETYLTTLEHEKEAS